MKTRREVRLALQLVLWNEAGICGLSCVGRSAPAHGRVLRRGGKPNQAVLAPFHGTGLRNSD
jgi:hypothetical protein